MKLLKSIIQRKVLIALMVVLIIFFGVYAYSGLDRELTPEVDLNGATIEVDTEDFNVVDTESKITDPLEDDIQKVEGVKSVESTTHSDGVTFQTSFENDYDKSLVQELETVTQSFSNNFSEIKDISVNENGSGTEYGFTLDISGGDMSEMSEFALDELEPRLKRLSEVSDIKFSGINNQYIDIAYKEDELEDHEIEVEQVNDIINQVNSKSSLGELSDEDDNPSLIWDTEPRDVDDIKDIEIPSQTDDITVDDIADVSLNDQDHTSDVWKNGEEKFILVQIKGSENTTQIEMAEAVRHELDKIHDDDLVDGFSVNEVVAHGDFVNQSMDSVTLNILIGGIIAVLVLLLFLRNLRATIIIAISIPTSILLTIASIWLLDYSLNMLTLVGLGLGIGMMVDSSIVILESIYSKKEEGLSSFDSVIKGTQEVSNAIIASVLTTIAVFLPIGLVGGDEGKMMIILSIVVAITLISSVVIAFTVIPALAEKFMKMRKKRKQDRKEKGILKVYNRMMAWIIAKKLRSFAVIILSLILFSSSLFLIPKIPMNTMPDIFNRYTEISVELENGTSNDEKQELADSINEKLNPIKDVKSNYLIDQGNSFVSVIKMTSGDEVHNDQKEVTSEVLRELRDLQHDNPIRSVQSALEGSGGYPVEINLKGEDFDKLQSTSKDIVKEIETIDGVVGATGSMEVTSNAEEIELDTDELESNDISKAEMQDWIDQALLGDTIGEIEGEYDRDIPINVSWEDYKGTEKDLLDREIPIDDKKFSSFIELQDVDYPEEIKHENGDRSVAIYADIEDRDLGAVNRDVQKVIDDFELDSGYSMSLGGELEEQQDLNDDILFALLISIFLVYLIMAVQFNHFGHPIIVMATIPIAIVGVIAGMFITQMELNIMSGMGLIMLVGIVLNNAILLVNRTNQLRESGFSLNDAIITGGQDRFRPIFMTTFTTVGGMLPLALASGMSADYQAPLATVIISGLLFSTLITLVLIPTIYRLFSKQK